MIASVTRKTAISLEIFDWLVVRSRLEIPANSLASSQMLSPIDGPTVLPSPDRACDLGRVMHPVAHSHEEFPAIWIEMRESRALGGWVFGTREHGARRRRKPHPSAWRSRRRAARAWSVACRTIGRLVHLSADLLSSYERNGPNNWRLATVY